jgi:hypothetical protein
MERIRRPKGTQPESKRNEALAIEVFDFEKNWHLVKPHLPAAEQALADGLNDYFAQRAEECVERGLNPKRWQIRYDPSAGPWSYCSSDYWLREASLRAEDAILGGKVKWDPPEDYEDEGSARRKFDAYYEICCRFAPQPHTFEWYQLFGACHWLVPWQLKLGKLIFSQMKWMAVNGELHSFAGGLEGTKARMIFDILNFKTKSAAELIEWVREPVTSVDNHLPDSHLRS